MKTHITEEEIKNYSTQVSILSNQARYKEAETLTKKLYKKYPHVLQFQYLEAVFSAEDTVGFSQKKLASRFKKTSEKLKKVLVKLRGVSPQFNLKVRNEYYWFSKQPYKQYKLGLEGVSRGIKRAYYSQGVGAAMLAEKYALQRKRGLAHRWAKISENAWLNYFKIVPDWYNSYIFYAMALGFQSRIQEMDQALEKCRIIAKRPKNWSAITHYRKEIMSVLNTMSK